jgi:hypothetical protein
MENGKVKGCHFQDQSLKGLWILSCSFLGFSPLLTLFSQGAMLSAAL